MADDVWDAITKIWTEILSHVPHQLLSDIIDKHFSCLESCVNMEDSRMSNTLMKTA